MVGILQTSVERCRIFDYLFLLFCYYITCIWWRKSGIYITGTCCLFIPVQYGSWGQSRLTLKYTSFTNQAYSLSLILFPKWHIPHLIKINHFIELTNLRSFIPHPLISRFAQTTWNFSMQTKLNKIYLVSMYTLDVFSPLQWWMSNCSHDSLSIHL